MPNNPNGPSQDEKNDKKDIKKLGSENMTVELSSSFLLSLSLSLSLLPFIVLMLCWGRFTRVPTTVTEKLQRERERFSLLSNDDLDKWEETSAN